MEDAFDGEVRNITFTTEAGAGAAAADSSGEAGDRGGNIISSRIATAEAQIAKVEEQIGVVSEQFNKALVGGNETLVLILSKREEQLREEKRQLREEKRLLLEQGSLTRKRGQFSCDYCTDAFGEEFELAKHAVAVHGQDVICDLECGGDGTFVDIHHLACAGLSTAKGDRKRYFLRQKAKDLLQQLGDCADTKSLLIQGPPGTGKSSIVWLWACSVAAVSDVLWVNLSPQGVSTCARLCGGKVYSWQTKFSDVETILSDCKSHTIVLDGLTDADKKLIGTALMGLKRIDGVGGPRVVAVSSAQLVLPGEHLRNSRIVELAVDSWTLEQYKEACTDARFYEGVAENLGDGDTIEEKVLDKFCVAGGSARWMFDFTQTDARSEIDKQLLRCNNPSLLIADGVGPSSSAAVNHLRQKFGDRHFVVSKYALRMLVDKCNTAFIRTLSDVASQLGNDAFDGWVFELDFLLQLRLLCEAQDGRMQVFRDDGSAEEWQGSARRMFSEVAELSGQVYHCRDWLIPKKWNQGGYDAVQILDRRVRFVQVTRGETHGLKLHYMALLIRALVDGGMEVAAVDIVVLVPRNHEFRRPTAASVTGDLRAWGWELSALRVLQLTRSTTAAVST